jgi:hypothetical protein
MEGIFSVVFGLLALFIVLCLYILLPAGMAERRSRSQLIWVLISLFGSPILACLLLLASGRCRVIFFAKKAPKTTVFERL